VADVEILMHSRLRIIIEIQFHRFSSSTEGSLFKRERRCVKFGSGICFEFFFIEKKEDSHFEYEPEYIQGTWVLWAALPLRLSCCNK
jgi:hypothetical protein